jgi:hypothetical protein
LAQEPVKIEKDGEVAEGEQDEDVESDEPEIAEGPERCHDTRLERTSPSSDTAL